MKIWLDYECDFGHSWEILRDITDSEQPGDYFCVQGHEAVVARRAKPGDFVSVSVFPAARVVDSVTGRIGLENKFYIILQAISSEWQVISSGRYSKLEAWKIVEMFTGLDVHMAKKLWQSKNLGIEGYRIDS